MSIFNGTNGNDIFNGGSGIDTVTFADKASGYLIETLADGRVQVTDINRRDGDTGVDILNSIEILRFADKDYGLELAGASGPSGSTRINTYTNFDQWDSAITALADGGYVITWSSSRQDGSGDGVYAQRFDALGKKVGSETQVNSTTTDSQGDAAITTLADGGYVITWTSVVDRGEQTNVYAQRFNANGSRVGGETLINSYTSDDQHEPAVTALDSGYVIAWVSDGQEGSGRGVYAQRFDASGNALGAETRIDSHGNNFQDNPAITALTGGGYVVTWTSLQQGGNGYEIFARRFDASGNATGGETQVNTHSLDSQLDPAITALDDGGYVIAWVSREEFGSAFGVFAQRFSASGVALGAETKINTVAAAYEEAPAITTLADGSYVISWTSSPDLGSFEVHAQRFAVNGNRMGSEIKIDVGTGGYDAITALDDGGYVITWTSAPDDVDYNVFAKRFDAFGNAWGESTHRITGTAAADTLNAGKGDQTLLGKDGADILNAGDGADLLAGGKGNDTLNGGAGTDTFLFDAALDARNNKDKITGFVAADDTLQLDQLVFKQLAKGALGTGNFVSSRTGTAVDANDFVLYESDTGKLLYDADGNGKGAAILFATLSGHPVISASDFVIV